MTPRILHADAVLSGEGPAVRDGAVVVADDGTVIDVGPADQVLPRHAGAAVERSSGVLLPGLVNAHTHVELSGLRGKVAGGHGFAAWVERMIRIRAAERPEHDGEAIERAVAEMVGFGTVAVGEVTNTFAGVAALARHDVTGIVFCEVFGLDREHALARVAAIGEERAARMLEEGELGLVYAPAPHTVYTTHPDAVRALVAEARRLGLRTTVHLAEHPAERTFLVHGTGPVADFAARMHLPIERFPVPHKGPVDAAADLGLLAEDVLLVHLTDARPDELAMIAASGAPVVVCPRSNLFIEVKLPPLPEMLRLGIVPALGTDSLASNATLDPLAEARALADRFPSVPKGMLLQMATAAGARALGLPELGAIAKGKRPGILAISGALSRDQDPFDFALRQPTAQRSWAARRRENPSGKAVA